MNAHRTELPVWAHGDKSKAFATAMVAYLCLGVSWSAAFSLAQAAYWYPNDVIAASDDDLLSLRGIGPARLKKIRDIFDAGVHPHDPDVKTIYERAKDV